MDDGADTDGLGGSGGMEEEKGQDAKEGGYKGS